MTVKHIIAAMAFVLFSATSSGATTLSFDFSFSNDIGDSVVGTIEGLTDNATGAATSVTATVFPNGGTDLGPFDFLASNFFVSSNDFTVTNGDIVSANFLTVDLSEGRFIELVSPSGTFIGQFSEPGIAVRSEQLEFTPSGGGASAVPLPAAGWLLLSGLMGLAGLRRWKGRAQ